MRIGKADRLSDLGIDGGEGRGIRLGGSDTGAVPTTTTRKRRTDDTVEEDALIETPPTPFEDYEEFAGENDTTPDDRRRDPLRKSW